MPCKGLLQDFYVDLTHPFKLLHQILKILQQGFKCLKFKSRIWD